MPTTSAQLWNQQFAAHAFGISPNAPEVPYTQTIGYEAYKTVDPGSEPAFFVNIIYAQLDELAIGIQMAGPHLTPTTFQQGMFNYPPRLGPMGLWGFSAAQYTIPDDVREICWNPNAVSPFNGKQGAYMGTSNQRWTLGQIPKGKPGCPIPGVIDRAAARPLVVTGAIMAIYLVALVATGTHGYVHRKAPIGVVLLGVVYGSVTALGAFGLILIYRASRFINFAQGALGSMVGVVAIGLVKGHGLNYWIALPSAVAIGALVGGLDRGVDDPAIQQVEPVGRNGREHRSGPGVRGPGADRHEQGRALHLPDGFVQPTVQCVSQDRRLQIPRAAPS